MKIDSKFLQAYVVASTIAIIALIAGTVYMSISLHNVSKNVNDMSDSISHLSENSQPLTDTNGNSITNDVQDISHKVDNICNALNSMPGGDCQ